MNSQLAEVLHNLFAFDITAHLLSHDFVQQALLAGALLGLVAGLIGPFIVMRQMSFAVHGSSELSLTGAAFALLVGFEVGVGRADRQRLGGRTVRHSWSASPGARFGRPGWCWRSAWAWPCCSSTSTPGRTSTSFALLTGQIVGVGYSGLAMLGAGVPAGHRRADGVLPTAAVRHRRLRGRRRPRRAGSRSGHRVRRAGRCGRRSGRANRRGAAGDVAADHPGGRGGPGGAAPAVAIVVSVIFAEVAAVGGIVLSLAPGVPVSVFVATISFLIYLFCWLLGRRREVRA